MTTVVRQRSGTTTRSRPNGTGCLMETEMRKQITLCVALGLLVLLAGCTVRDRPAQYRSADEVIRVLSEHDMECGSLLSGGEEPSEAELCQIGDQPVVVVVDDDGERIDPDNIIFQFELGAGPESYLLVGTNWMTVTASRQHADQMQDVLGGQLRRARV